MTERRKKEDYVNTQRGERYVGIYLNKIYSGFFSIHKQVNK